MTTTKISEEIYLENFLAIYYKIRKSALVILNRKDVDDHINLAKKLKIKFLVQDYDISNRKMDMFYTFNTYAKENLANKVAQLKIYTLDFVKEAGEWLEYPQCCIKNAMFLGSKKIDPNLDLQDKLVESQRLLQIINPYVFFASEFIPCSLDCNAAKFIGNTIYKKFCKIDKNLALKYSKLQFKHIQDAKLAKVVRRYSDKD